MKKVTAAVAAVSDLRKKMSTANLRKNGPAQVVIGISLQELIAREARGALTPPTLVEDCLTYLEAKGGASACLLFLNYPFLAPCRVV